MPPESFVDEDETEDRNPAEEPRAPSAGPAAGPKEPPQRRSALQVRTARYNMVAGAMDRVAEAHGALIDAPKQILDNVKENVGTATVINEGSRQNAGAAMHQAKAGREFNQTLAEGYKELGDILLARVRELKASGPAKGKFEVIVEAGERLFGRVGEKVIEEAGPVLLDLIALKFPALAQALKAKEDAAAGGEGTPKKEPAQGAGAREPLDEAAGMRLLYDALPPEARRVMSFEAFCRSMDRAAE